MRTAHATILNLYVLYIVHIGRMQTLNAANVKTSVPIYFVQAISLLTLRGVNVIARSVKTVKGMRCETNIPADMNDSIKFGLGIDHME